MADTPTLTLVYAQVKIEGRHFWDSAPVEVIYLRNPHRHIFHIKAAVQVKHDDRDVEFIMLGHRITAWLKMRYPIYGFGADDMLDFGESSCEMIARELLDRFDLYSCEVSEDGENGAIVTRS